MKFGVGGVGMVVIDVCVATFRRNDMLRVLLESLKSLRTDGLFDYKVIVVDNDKSGGARGVVSCFAESCPREVVYAVQPIKNISMTRNEAVKLSSGCLLAFIDDDEYAEKDWLFNLYCTIKKTQASAALGPVLPVFPMQRPQWVVKGGFYERPRFRTGVTLDSGRTANALVDKKCLSNFIGPFDEKLGLTGGEDTLLFKQILDSGGMLVWCDEAVVYEHVPHERMTLAWLCRRAFRGGQGYAAMFVQEFSALKKVKWFIEKIGIVVIVAPIVVLCMPLSRVVFVWLSIKLAASLGQLSSIGKYRFQEYA